VEKRLTLSSADKKIAGVCGGIAKYFKFEPSLVRIIWVLLTLVLDGVPAIIYIALWAIMPKE